MFNGDNLRVYWNLGPKVWNDPSLLSIISLIETGGRKCVFSGLKCLLQEKIQELRSTVFFWSSENNYSKTVKEAVVILIKERKKPTSFVRL